MPHVIGATYWGLWRRKLLLLFMWNFDILEILFIVLRSLTTFIALNYIGIGIAISIIVLLVDIPVE